MLAPAADWRNVEIRLEARKRAGDEGFMILFRARDMDHFYWWNVGGWRNKVHGIEKEVAGKRTVVHRADGGVASNTWHDLRIRAEGRHIRCYLNEKLIHDWTDADDALARGTLGLGTWRTAAEYRNVTVTDLDSGRTLLQSPPVDPTAEWRWGTPRTLDFANWQKVGGTWEQPPEGGVRQTTLDTNCRLIAPKLACADYAFEVEGRKLAGAEGFMIIIRAQNPSTFNWWNVGGWANAQHGIERKGGPGNSILHRLPGSVETGRWYRLRVEVVGDRIRCYLDGKLVQEARDSSYRNGTVGLATWRTQVEYRNPVLIPTEGSMEDLTGLYERGPTFAITTTALAKALAHSGERYAITPWQTGGTVTIRSLRPVFEEAGDGQECLRRRLRLPQAGELRLTASGKATVWVNGFLAGVTSAGQALPLRLAGGDNDLLLQMPPGPVSLRLTESLADATLVNALRQDFPQETQLVSRRLGGDARLAAWLRQGDGAVMEAARKSAALPALREQLARLEQAKAPAGDPRW